MKRFWDHAEARAGDEGFAVWLDGRPVRLPDGTLLALPTYPLAEAVAREWQSAGGARGGQTGWSDLPLTRLAGTAQQRIATDSESVALELVRWAESDLLCYRAERPPALVARQRAEWQPLLDWAAARYGARLEVTSGIVHIAQPPRALAALAQVLAAQPVVVLTALGVVVPALGSLVLGLALAESRLDAESAWTLASLDERFQAELWGCDAEAERRRQAIGADVALAARFLALSRP